MIMHYAEKAKRQWLATFATLFLLSILPLAQCGAACLSNPCIHGVCLDDVKTQYFCYCIDGYTGIQCQTNWNECWSSPCQNGGLCVDGIAMFNCTCPSGFVGDLCEENFNECESNPCQNNGTCVDDLNGYICNCLSGFTGTHCELDVAVCNSTNETRCSNGGACIEGHGDTFSCQCAPGFEGYLCDDEIDECRSNPCRNGGLCIDLLAEYSCACRFGFTGHNCEAEIQFCDDSICQNGAVCLMEASQPTCYCVPDYHGDLCQFKYDECQLSPPRCKNGGSCIDGIDNFTCSCPPKLTGVFCECLIIDENTLDCTYISPSTETYTSSTESYKSSTATILIGESTKLTSSESTLKETTPEENTSIDWKTTSDVPKNVSEIETTTSDMFSTTLPTLDFTKSSTEINFPNLTSTAFSTLYGYSSETTSYAQTTPYVQTTFDILTTSTEQVSLPIATTSETTTDFVDITSFYSSPSSTDFTEHGREFNNFTLQSDFTTFGGISETTPWITTTTLDEYLTTLEHFETTILPGEIITNISVLDCSISGQECQNEGICILTKEGHTCQCPFGTEGSLCETTTEIKNVAFNGNSYLVHKLENYSNILIEFQAKTLVSNGVVFYASIDSAYMLLYIENGYLKFKFSCGFQTMLLSELKVTVNTGFVLNISANLRFNKDFSFCIASVKLNNTLSMAGDQTAVFNKFTKPSAKLFLGGTPSDYSSSFTPGSGFFGCIKNLKISNQHVSMIRSAEDAFGVSECNSLACLSNPCSNGATCLSNNQDYECRCKNGFLGKYCEQSVCDNNPCLFGGTCLSFPGSGYICLCPYRKHGHFCESDMKISEPYFSPMIRGLSSYVAYSIPNAISRNMEIKFKFTPTSMEQISLLLFLGQKGYHDAFSDHVSVSFVKGYIMLTWNLGSGHRRIFTNEPIQKGARDYLVHIGHNGKRAWLYVENLGNITGRSPGPSIELNVYPLIYIGGHESRNFSSLPHDLPLHNGFMGCIFDVQFVSGSVTMSLQGSELTQGRAVGQCGSTECSQFKCQNKGACLHHGSTFACLCQDSWFGPLCSTKLNPCDTSVHKCDSGSTCVPLMETYECDCPFGKVGKYCEKDENITDISMTGTRSFVVLTPVELETNRLSIEMEIRSLTHYGLILFLGNVDTFVSLALQSGTLELRIQRGRNRTSSLNQVTIRSLNVLQTGVWHYLQFGIFGRKTFLTVGNSTTTSLLPESHSTLLLREHIFLGGLNDMSNLPLEAMSSLPTHYTGCIRNIRLDDLHIPLQSQNIKEGRNIIDCDGTPCGGDICQNGGTCWLDSSLVAHCACVDPYYGKYCNEYPKCDQSSNSICGSTRGVCQNEKCVCNVGYHGVSCKENGEVHKPQFGTDSYMILGRKEGGDSKNKRGVQNLEMKELRMNFTTAKDDGLLLWSKMENTFMGIGIEHGYLKIAYSSGKLHKTSIEVLHYHPVSDGLWHNIEITYQPLTIRLDQHVWKNKLDKNNTTMLTNGVFYLGNVPTNKSLGYETHGLFLNYFEGCMDKIETNLEKLQNFSAFEGQNVNECKLV